MIQQRKLKGGIRSLWPLCYSTVAAATILMVTYGGQVTYYTLKFFRQEQHKLQLLGIYVVTKNETWAWYKIMQKRQYTQNKLFTGLWNDSRWLLWTQHLFVCLLCVQVSTPSSYPRWAYSANNRWRQARSGPEGQDIFCWLSQKMQAVWCHKWGIYNFCFVLLFSHQALCHPVPF